MAESSDVDLGCLLWLGAAVGVFALAGYGGHQLWKDRNPPATPPPEPPTALEKCVKGEVPGDLHTEDARLLKALRVAYGAEVRAMGDEQLRGVDALATSLEAGSLTLSAAHLVVAQQWEEREAKFKLYREAISSACKGALRRASFPKVTPGPVAVPSP